MKPIDEDLLDDENGADEMDSSAEEWARSGLLDMMDDVVETLLDDTYDQLAILTEIAEDGDCEGALRLGKSLRSAAGSLHAPGLTDVFKQIESAAKSGDAGTIRQLMPVAEFEFARVRAGMSKPRAA
jgi:HPt (histidine-containing phosphotransfer) domain-containing protein